MALVLHASGTLSSTVASEDFLTSPNVAGIFSLQVDLSGMLAGDVVELRAYKMVLTGGTSRAMWFQGFYGVQPADGLIVLSVAIPNTLTDTNAVRFSLKQTFGTTRNYAWAVYNECDNTEFTRLGAPAGASVSDDIAAVKVDTAAIKTKTDNLPVDPADASDIAAAFSTVNGTLATIAGYIDTEVAAIKAVTDALPNAGALTTIQADLDDIQTRLPAALVSGRMDSSVGAMAANVVTAAAIATDAIDADAIKADALAEIAAAVEAAILDEGDATPLLAAISAKVEEFLINEGDATATLAAIAAAVRTNLTTELGRIDATISSRATQASVDDLPTNAELATALGTADDAMLAAIALVQADTDNIQTRLPAALVGGKMDSTATVTGGVDVVSIAGSTAAAENQRDAALAIYRGTVTGAATTTTLIDSGLTQANVNHWNGRIIIFTTGTLALMATDILAFDPATDKLTFTALTATPSGGDEFLIL